MSSGLRRARSPRMSPVITSSPRLRHSERAACLVVTDAGTHQHDQAAGLHLALFNGMVERHADAGGACVPVFFHNRVRAIDGYAEPLHYACNRRFPHLGEDEAIHVAQVETAVLGEPLR